MLVFADAVKCEIGWILLARLNLCARTYLGEDGLQHGHIGPGDWRCAQEMTQQRPFQSYLLYLRWRRRN
jgi:hypothetical protein